MALIDSYSEANGDQFWVLNGLHPSAGVNNSALFQSFRCLVDSNYKLTSVKVSLRKTGNPSGFAYFKLYAHNGTFGVDSTPIGSPLAVSDPIDVSLLPTDFQLIQVFFSGINQHIMQAGATYVLVFGEMEAGMLNADNRVDWLMDFSAPTHLGNAGNFNSGNWMAVGGWDMAGWYIYGEPTTAPPQAIITITTTAGGTTNPAPNTYSVDLNSTLSIQAISDTSYAFDHWELDEVNVGSTNPTSVTMDTNHTLLAVFVAQPPPPPTNYTLTENSTPIQGIPFTREKVS